MKVQAWAGLPGRQKGLLRRPGQWNLTAHETASPKSGFLVLLHCFLPGKVDRHTLEYSHRPDPLAVDSSIPFEWQVDTDVSRQCDRLQAGESGRQP